MNWENYAIELLKKLQNKYPSDVFKNEVQELEKLLLEKEVNKNESTLLNQVVAVYYTQQKVYAKASHHFQQALNRQPNSEEGLKYWIAAHFHFVTLDKSYNQFQQARTTLARLLQFYEKKAYSDEHIARVYHEIGRIFVLEEDWHQAHTKFELAKKLYQSAYPVTSQVVIDLVHELAEVYIQLDQVEVAIHLYEQILRRNKKEASLKLKATLTLRVGELYFHSNIKEARKKVTEALNLYQDDPMFSIRCNMLLAEIDELSNALPRAIKYYHRALNKMEEFLPKKHFLIIFSHAKLGSLYLVQNNRKDAKQYLEKGLYMATDYPKLMMQYYQALGNLYAKEEDYALSNEMYGQFLSILEHEGKINGVAYAHTLVAIAENHSMENDTSLRVARLLEAHKLYQRLGSNCREDIAFVAFQLGISFQKDSDEKNDREAETYLLQSWKLLQSNKNVPLKEEVNLAIIEFYKKHGKQDRCFKYENDLIQLQKLMA